MEKMIKLDNGILIPRLGLGPGMMGSFKSKITLCSRWNIPLRAWNKYVARPYENRVLRTAHRDQFVNAIADGIRAGVRLIDYSAAYGNGNLIADAIERSGIPREEIFLTGRISNRAQFGGSASIREQIVRHLAEYRTDYVDLLMFHWPVTDCFETTWRVISEEYEKGTARSIGVANCHPHHVKKLLNCGLRPMLNQFEVHPLFTQKDLIKFNQDNGILVESYTPIARMDARLFRLPALNKIARNHGKSAVQVVLRWHVQQGLVPIFRSKNMQRIKENLDVFDFELSDVEMNTIDGFNINSRLRYDPDNCDFTIL